VTRARERLTHWSRQSAGRLREAREELDALVVAGANRAGR
jgi:hypothetical protein